MLAHDLEAVAVRDDVLDFRNRVTRQDREEHGVGPDLFVLRCSERHGLGAVGVSALADEVDQVERASFTDLLDPLVDLAEERFVAGQPFLAPFASLVGGQSTSSFETMRKPSSFSTIFSPSSRGCPEAITKWSSSERTFP